MLNQINDIRDKFNNISFSGFQKSKWTITAWLFARGLSVVPRQRKVFYSAEIGRPRWRFL